MYGASSVPWYACTLMPTRVAIVGGARTPFAKMNTSLKEHSALQLGAHAVRAAMSRSGVSPDQIDRIVFGQVVPSLVAPNIARELVFDLRLPPTVDAYSVSRACTTSYQAVIDLARAIALGEVDCGIAGGADSASGVPIAVSKPLAKAFVSASRTKSLTKRVRAFASLRPRDLVPEPPTLVERSTGLTMGESAEYMSRENGISRAEQDECALRSHQRATAAWADKRYHEEVAPIGSVIRDNLVRKNVTLSALSGLRPIFNGTLTAGNSAALTDGGSAVVLMREDKARAHGLDILGVIKSHASVAIDPAGQMLLGPAFSTPKALELAGMKLADVDLIDIHEAFAAQVLSVTKVLGGVDWERTNVMGGSIAIGHPFAATGTRQISQTLRELKRRGGGTALCTACAAGGLATTMIFESA